MRHGCAEHRPVRTVPDVGRINFRRVRAYWPFGTCRNRFHRGGPTSRAGPSSGTSRTMSGPAAPRPWDQRLAGSVDEFQSTLRGRLFETFADPKFRPPVLPTVAIELMRLSRNKDVGIDDVVKVLEKDQVLTADLLRLAQSAAYIARSDARSIHGAVSRIGLNRAADLFLRAALEAKIFRVNGYAHPLERLRRHSIATAEIGRSRRCGVCRPNFA
jgi:hypothetical protein